MADSNSNANDPIFAIPRHEYASYRDYHRIIELSGFKTCFIDQIDQSSDNHYIITIYNGEFGDYSGSRAKIYLTDIEWHLGSNALPSLPNVTLLACDAWYAKQIGARYFPMGSHPGLCPAMTPKQDLYDVAFIGYFDGVPRRQVIRRQLLDRGVRVSPTGAWGDERHALLRNSAAFLHVHQLENAPTIAPLRMVLAAAYALPYITELYGDSGIFSEYLYSAPYDRLADHVRYLIDATHERLIDYGVGLHQLLCYDLTFRKSVEAAL